MKPFNYALLLMIVCSSCAHSDNADDLTELINTSKEMFGDLDGYWIGTISSANHFSASGEQIYNQEIVILVDDQTPNVYHKKEDNYVVYDYKYEISRTETSVLIYMLSAKQGWSEIMTYSLSLESQDVMSVVWTRIVNNFVYPLENEQARAYFYGASKFTKHKP